MRLLRLEIENWACHEKRIIDLSGGLQIEGRNGTGKSSILEAIRFIFSERARGYSPRIKRGTNSARVKLRFEKDGEVYSIEKKLYAKKTSTATMWINRYPVADNQSSVYKRLQEVITENILDKLIYVPQGSLTELVSRLRVKGGKQELDALLGLDKFERIYKGTAGEIRVGGAQLEMILKQIARYPEDAEKGYNEEIRKLKDEKVSLATKFDEYNKNKRILDSKIEQLGRKLEEIRDTKKKKDDLERRINELKLKGAELGKGLESIKTNLEMIVERKREIDKLIGTEGDLKRYTPMRDLLTGLKNVEGKLKELDGLENKERVLGKIEGALKNRDEIQAGYDKDVSRVMELERGIAISGEKLDEQKKYLADLDSLDRKAKCPRCGQMLTEEHLKKEKEIAGEMIKGLAGGLEDLTLDLGRAKTKGDALKKELDELNQKGIEKGRLEAEIKKGRNEQKSHLSYMENIKKDLTSLGYLNETLSQVNDKITELGNIRGRINIFKEEIGKQGDYVLEIQRLGDQLSQVSGEEKKLQGEFDKLRYDDGLFEDLEGKREEFREKHAGMSIETERCEFQMRETQNRTRELNSKRDEFLELGGKKQKIEHEINLMKHAQEIFHTNKGIVKYLRERYIQQLSISLTRYFKRINQNPKYRNITFDKDYEIGIETTGGNFSMDQLSGGEKVQLAIALRIALLELLSPTRLLILDEPFGSLDSDHRDVLGEALNKVAGDGQLILVTHIPVDSLELPKLELGGY